jgi:hypothetical protein
VYLNNYLTTPGYSKFNDQEIRINLFIPVGTILKYDRGNGRSWVMRAETDRSNDDLQDYTWKMGSNGVLVCLDCPEDVEIEDERENRININENGIDININEDGEKGKIIINEDGIDIDVKDHGESFKMKLDKNGIKIKTDENEESDNSRP